MSNYNAERVESELAEVLAENWDEAQQMASFAEAGVLTNDNGFVLAMKDGSEFQITIVQSR